MVRNKLNAKNERQLFISSLLVILFLITNATLPYPDSLYWFVALGVLGVSLILSFSVLKKEFNRFKSLRIKDKLTNILFYTLLIVVTHIYI